MARLEVDSAADPVAVDAPDAALASEPVEAVRAPVRKRRRDWGMVLGVAWIVFVVAIALLAPVLPLQDPLELNPGAGRQGPGADHWLGADQLGRDQLARLAWGARVSLLVGFGATILSGVVGVTMGLIAGFYRRATDGTIMGAVDILLAFPALILAIALTSLLGASVRNVIIAIAFLGLPAFTRVARAQTLAYAERDFVKAARSVGASNARIMIREIAPNILPTMVSYALVIVAIAIVVEGALSFLGLSVSAEIPTWGGMIDAGRGDLERAAHISLIPAATMFLTVLAFNSVGDKLARRHGGVSAGVA